MEGLLMSLINCPECGNELSNEAVACPNCGRPLSAPTPTIQRRVIVTEPREEGFLLWKIHERAGARPPAAPCALSSLEPLWNCITGAIGSVNQRW